MKNSIEIVKRIYEYFQTGNIPGILNELSDDATFKHPTNPKLVPFGGVFKGKEEITNFFKAITKSLQTTKFETLNFIQENNQVKNEVIHEAVVKNTGKRFSIKALFIWNFNDNGEISNWNCKEGNFSDIDQAFL